MTKADIHDRIPKNSFFLLYQIFNLTLSSKRLIFFFVISLSSLNLFSQKSFHHPSGGEEKTWITNDPFNLNVFIQNYGQFDNWTKDAGVIKYAVNKSDKIFFTNQGLTFSVDKVVGEEENELSENEKESKHSSAAKNSEKEEEHPTVEQYAVHMSWEGCNQNIEIIASDETSNYYTFGEKGFENVKAKGYKTILYKNLYNGIDVEYSIPEKGGIKYKLIVHPGADVGKIKMTYTGDVTGVKIDIDGNIVISTPAGDIIDHAPQAFYETGGNEVASSYKFTDNSVQFDLPSGFDPQKTLIIDPWTIVPVDLTTDNSAFDMAYDDNGNVYVSGGVVPYKLSKYTSAGTLIWTFTNPAGFGSTYGYYSRFCIIPSSGSTVIGEGWNSSGPLVMKINPSGALVYTTPNFPGNQEIWVMFYNRCTGKMVGFGGGTANANNMQIIADTSLSTSVCSNFNGNSSADNDVAAAEEDYNGDFYALMSSIVAGSDNGWIMKSLSSINYASPDAWEVSAGYNSAECYNYGIPGLSNSQTVRANSLALNDNYLFCYDGGNLKAYNKATGAQLGATVVNAAYATGQNRTHEGIAVDDCNNVYVGGTSQVHVFSFNGSAFTAAGSIPMSNEVYDIRLNRTSGTLFVCGLGFVTSTPATANCATSQLNLNATPTAGVCDGSATVTVGGGTSPYTYIWSNGLTTNSISGVPTGWYYVTVTDNSCIRLRGVDSVFISSSFPTTVSNDTAVCSGIQVPLFATGGITYAWTPATSLSNPAIANPIASPANTTMFYVTISNGTCNKTDSVKVTVSPMPVVSNSASPNPICAGVSTTLSANGAATYLWSGGLGTASTVTVTPASTTSYTVTGTTAGCSAAAAITVTVNPVPVANAGTDQIICNGQSVNLTAFGGGTYLWSNTSTNQSTNVSPNVSTNYTVTVTTNGCTAVDSVLVTVNNPPVATVSPDQAICSGLSANLSVTGGSIYVWSPSSSLNNPNISNPVATPATTTTYNVTVTDNNGCTDLANTTITVNLVPDAQISTFAPATCGLNNGSATATGGSTYLWSNGLSTATITGLAPGNYDVTVTSAAGCTDFTSVTVNNIPVPTVTASSTNEICERVNGTATATVINGVAPVIYNWSNTYNSQIITGLPAGLYTVTITDANGCTSFASTTIVNIPGPDLQVLSFVNEICSYGNGTASVTAFNGVPPYNYLWSNGSPSASISNLHAGVYTITVTDANNCPASDTVTINNSPGPTVNIAGFNLASCGISDGSASLNVTGGTPGYTFLWNSTPQQFMQNLQNVPTGSYCVTVTDANGCSTSTCVTIGEKAGPSATISSQNEICNQANGTATVVATGGLGSYTYLWNTGLNTPTITGLTQGNYSVVVSDSGCSTSVSVSVLETYGPIAGFSAHPTVLTIMDGPVSFLDNSSGNIVNWQWNYGDGSAFGSGSNNTHPYLNIGTYLATLIVTDNNGCTDTTSDTIHVKDIFTIYIPNAFTPNTDGINDFFTPRGINVDPNDFNMYIFDRWGSLMFHTSVWDINLHQAEPWNGTKDNSGTYKDVVMDVYVYRIVLKELEGTRHEYVGRVTLIP